MHLWLVRHAAAADRDSWPGPDPQRPITARARERLRKLVARLESRNVAPDVIMTSPAVRTVQTAEILASIAGFVGEVEIEPGLAEDATAAEAIARAQRQGVGIVAAVGHEPQLSAIVLALLGEAPARFQKGGLIALEVVPRGKASFEFAIVPKRAKVVGSLRKLAAEISEAVDD
jgi:phosphohistidine phosphatase